MSSDAPAVGSDSVEGLIANLYRYGLDIAAPEYRPWALGELARVVPCDGVLWGSGSIKQRRFHTVTLRGLPVEFPAQLEATAAINPIVPRLMANLGTPIDMADVIDDREFYRSELYQQVFAPHGIERILSTAHLDPRSGLYTLLTLYRRERAARFSADERTRQQRLVYHLSQASSHAFFLHLARTLADRPPQAACAVVDRHGVFHEAEPRFLQMLDEHVPGRRQPQQLPLPVPTPGMALNYLDLKLSSTALGDRFVVTLWRAGPLDRLTPREREVVFSVAQGLSFKQAAKKIGVAPSTVANHLYRIYRKLGLNNRTQLAALVHNDHRAP